MTRKPDPIDQRFEHLLREQMPSPAPDELSGLVHDLRHEYVAPFPPEVQNRQIAGMVAAGRDASGTRPTPFRRKVNGYWYRFSQRFVAGSLVGKIVLAASFAAAATTSIAATGHLPAEIQLAVSRAAAEIGVSIPSPAPEPAASQRPPSPPSPKLPAVAVAPSGSAPPAASAPVGAGVASPLPTPSTTPADACARTILASPPPPLPADPGNGDVLAAIQKITEEQLQLDALLKCLVPPPGGAPPSPSGELGSSGLSELLDGLLNPQG